MFRHSATSSGFNSMVSIDRSLRLRLVQNVRRRFCQFTDKRIRPEEFAGVGSDGGELRQPSCGLPVAGSVLRSSWAFASRLTTHMRRYDVPRHDALLAAWVAT